jgi:hypothetical protein
LNEVTRILSALEQGDPQAAEQLLPLVYEELHNLAAHKLAKEKPGQTLQATALVHEAYLRLVDGQQTPQWDSRAHSSAPDFRRVNDALKAAVPPGEVRDEGDAEQRP